MTAPPAPATPAAAAPHPRSGADLEAVALGIAPDATERSVLEHCRTCQGCTDELRTLYENVAVLCAAMPRSEMHRGHSAGIRSRLASRAAAEYDPKMPRAVVVKPAHAPDATRAEPRQHSTVVYGEPRRVVWPFLVAAAALVGAGVATMQAVNAGAERDAAVAGIPSPDSTDRRIAELEAEIREKDELIGIVGSQSVRVLSLVNFEARPRGRMFWDRRTGKWTLFIGELKQPRPGMAFQVWMVNRAGQVAAGTFTPRTDGTAFVQGRQPLEGGELQRIAISEEPIGGSRVPTGPIVLAGG